MIGLACDQLVINKLESDVNFGLVIKLVAYEDIIGYLCNDDMVILASFQRIGMDIIFLPVTLKSLYFLV